MDLKLIKYQGTYSFIASLFLDRDEEQYYFGFSKIYPPELNMQDDDEDIYGKYNVKIATLYKKKLVYEIQACPFGKEENLYYLIKINGKRRI